MKIDQRATLIVRVRNSLGAKVWCNTLTEDGQDITNDGLTSCAIFVSSQLQNAEYIPRMSATVASLERQLQDAGWRAIASPVLGAVFIWHAAEQTDGVAHELAGFVMEDGRAISHSDLIRSPAEHALDAGGREVRVFYAPPDWIE
jgi:hypothetical protein